MDIQSIKQRFGIIGNSPLMNRAIDIAAQVAGTDLSVLVLGESGVGKEFFPQIIHELSPRKHGHYLAINCGALPEGLIDSELFGHEKGSFTDAREARKGYFEEANGGTLFLDEVGDLPLSTQVRLLRVLETGEFLKVGSSKVQKTNVRIVAATNVDLLERIQMGKFREDLYYRLNAITINVPSLKQRPEDIELLFRKFSTDISEKYRTAPMVLSDEARQVLLSYPWPGNIRELKNISEKVTITEQSPLRAEALKVHLPAQNSLNRLPVLFGAGAGVGSSVAGASGMSEREILYNVLFEMQNDIRQLKQAMTQMGQGGMNLQGGVMGGAPQNFGNSDYTIVQAPEPATPYHVISEPAPVQEDLSLDNSEKVLIEKALKKYKGNRSKASAELGISERTIYRKIKEYGIERSK